MSYEFGQEVEVATGTSWFRGRYISFTDGIHNVLVDNAIIGRVSHHVRVAPKPPALGSLVNGVGYSSESVARNVADNFAATNPDQDVFVLQQPAQYFVCRVPKG